MAGPALAVLGLAGLRAFLGNRGSLPEAEYQVVATFYAVVVAILLLIASDMVRFFPDAPEWKERVTGFLEKRVFVRGSIRYFINGVPRAIKDIEDIEDATPDPNLPKADFGSIPDKDEAQDPVTFLRTIRVLEGV